jgi:hypothetical protein
VNVAAGVPGDERHGASSAGRSNTGPQCQCRPGWQYGRNARVAWQSLQAGLDSAICGPVQVIEMLAALTRLGSRRANVGRPQATSGDNEP